MRALWDGATHREERYAALAVARHRRARAWLAPDSVPLLRHLVVTGAWYAIDANVDDTTFWLRKGSAGR